MHVTELQDNHLFREIVEHSFDEIFVTDHKGIVLYVNEACEKNYGIAAKKLLGRNVEDLADELFTPSATIEVIKRELPVEIMQRTTKGKRLFVKSRPVFDSTTGNLIKVISYARDLSDMTKLKSRIHALEKQLKEHQQNSQESAFTDVIAESKGMQQVIKLMGKAARTEATLLIRGETGVGKTVLAKKVHAVSDRSQSLLHEVNCGELPQQVLETELFGNPEHSLEGLIQLTDGCTLFLDEISEMSLSLQSKLLRVLETKQIFTNNKNVNIDIRFIFTTNQDLEKQVREGQFREDLYYRLNVVPIDVPPLRNRKEDIYPLAHHFLRKFNEKYHQHKKISPIVMNAFYEYEWRGNVREMENLIERLVITSDTNEITIDQLPTIIKAGSISHADTLPEKLEELENYLILEAYDRYGSSYKVAESLGISQSSAIRKIRKYITEKEAAAEHKGR
ncbi:sigma 54-interacting transcriptional regulator [Halobacillus salinarum]|uniref:HTH-type transcriptional regulatory protein TyrR n=1 Tax=Halobacillus salinarum TaxID=2932257 RepID=A0ABY4EIF6_9BACI|nr:sigma 54-interacting transcriptional regulator [Halobacillus salinarum]UOQ44274.1 sigma 54-interacting transcriptional regulator [Halobacillus salinarum]